MKKEKEKGRKWDGKSRVSNEVYRKRWNEIFGNTSADDERPAGDNVSEKTESDVQ
jgi:hypothetical protein|tara:strand:- start:1355 stop:1519 length:165 start_codon:yes stop_codon:yes gene_type:complete